MTASAPGRYGSAVTSAVEPENEAAGVLMLFEAESVLLLSIVESATGVSTCSADVGDPTAIGTRTVRDPKCSLVVVKPVVRLA